MIRTPPLNRHTPRFNLGPRSSLSASLRMIRSCEGVRSSVSSTNIGKPQQQQTPSIFANPHVSNLSKSLKCRLNGITYCISFTKIGAMSNLNIHFRFRFRLSEISPNTTRNSTERIRCSIIVFAFRISAESGRPSNVSHSRTMGCNEGGRFRQDGTSSVGSYRQRSLLEIRGAGLKLVCAIWCFP